MNPTWLRLQAPFAAFRWLQAGVWRGTSPAMPPSAAWGLVLNVAGVETRELEGGDVTTTVRPDAPAFEVALGVLKEPGHAVLFQQLHGYPVGTSSSDLAARTHGAKYHIAPARRELLVDLDMVVGIRGEPPDLRGRILRGLKGESPEPRYGLPFAGDNNFLFNSIDVIEEPPPAHWYAPVTAGRPVRGSARLTVGIDRADSSRTTMVLAAPVASASVVPPSDAWHWVPRQPLS